MNPFLFLLIMFFVVALFLPAGKTQHKAKPTRRNIRSTDEKTSPELYIHVICLYAVPIIAMPIVCLAGNVAGFFGMTILMALLSPIIGTLKVPALKEYPCMLTALIIVAWIFGFILLKWSFIALIVSLIAFHLIRFLFNKLCGFSNALR
jgi:hypothetical protein